VEGGAAASTQLAGLQLAGGGKKGKKLVLFGGPQRKY
jgi:hypothetical protein